MFSHGFSGSKEATGGAVLIGGFDLAEGTTTDWDERVWDESAEVDSASRTTSGGDCLRDVVRICDQRLMDFRRKAK